MEAKETVYYRSEAITVTHSHIVIQSDEQLENTGWDNGRRWLFGYHGEQTLAMRNVTSIAATMPPKWRPVLTIVVGVLVTLSVIGAVIGIPLIIIGGFWYRYVVAFGVRLEVRTAEGGETHPVYTNEAEQKEIIEAVRAALVARG